MQGKGIVKFFLVVMAIVTIVQYLFIIPTQRVEREADEYANRLSSTIQDEVKQDSAKKALRSAYLDSMSSEQVWSIPGLKTYTYQELKSQQLALGLDLKGGMSVVLQVDLREFIRLLAQNSKDPTFNEALEQASQAQKQSQDDFVSLFADAWNELSDENTTSLAKIFQRNEALRDEINIETTDGEVVRILREKADETVDLTYELLKQRIDKLGVVQPNVSLDAERDLIIVELPGIDNPERAKAFLVGAANLEFYDVYRSTDAGIFQAIIDADQRLRLDQGQSVQSEILRIDTTYAIDSLGQVDQSEIVSIDTIYDTANNNTGPLLSNLSLVQSGGASIGLADRNKRDYIMDLLNAPNVKSLFPADLRFVWGRSPQVNYETREVSNQYELYMIKVPRDGKAPLGGDHVTEASAQPDPSTNTIAVSLDMDNVGARTWARMTTAAFQDNNRQVAVLLDGEVVSAPAVQSAITGGSTQITGNFSMQEATDLANVLQIGRLPAKTEIIQSNLVGPTLGADNINRSIKALLIGLGIVLLFMIYYYGGGGVVSILALLLNMLFIFGALASYGTVLTLPGIAGIVLTIGMAVDANVIIYERIREELRAGKKLGIAVVDGFHHSYSAIIDANVTTILTAMVLAYFGLGPIKGFAVVLIIGVLSSLFTAVLVGRLMIDSWLSRGKNLSFWTGSSKNAFANVQVDWIGKRKMAYIISGVIITMGIASMFTRGFDLGVDFKGGYSYNIVFEEDVTADELRDALTTTFDGQVPTVKAVDVNNTYNVVTDYLINAEEVDGVEPEDRVMQALHAGINQITTSDIDYNNFSNADGIGTHVNSFSQVGPTIADDIQQSAFYAAIFALLLIFLYLLIRFSKWQYSLGAVAALFHDTLVVLSIFSLLHGFLPFSMEIDQNFIAAILTVIGYSINDTVVVFDRIREVLSTYTKGDKKQLINTAINNTVSRTVITSVTTLFVVTVLWLFGGSSIKGFAFALVIGVLVGTYSSIFIATPIVHDLTDDLKAAPKTDTKKHFQRSATT